MDDATKGAIAAFLLLTGLLVIAVWSMSKGQREVPVDPRPSSSVSVHR